EGIIDEKRIDKHLRRILTLKFELGIFDTPYVDQKKADEVVHSKKHVDIALKAARESIVLLKNNNKTLPLNKKKIKKIAVFGPAADTPALGNYARGIIGNEITPLKGLHEIAGKDVEVILRKPGEDVVALAKSVDAAIVCVTIIEDEGLDRSNLDLPVIKRNIVAKTQEDEAMGLIVSPWKRDLEKGDQEALIKAVASSGTPTIVVMVNGSPITMQNWINDANAIIEPWYGGERSGIALAEVIFGEYNPAGRLPMTFPKTIGQVPLYYNFSPSGRGYAYHDMDEKPQFEFGFGLSYTTFEYSNARLSSDKMPLKELKNKVKVSVDVKNTGDREGDEVAQLYIRDAFSSVVQPLKALKGFKRIALKPGEIKTVTFELGKEELGLWNRDMKFVVEPGEFEVFIGSSCEKRQVPKLSFSISD
ncbi:MAG TPA: glycoside hydrolase family 3 C-terminal domain-containing protein, partial [Methylococcales bacterium]